MRCTWTRGQEQEKILVRAYGKKSELIINRERELINVVSLHEFHLAPRLYARFKNGFIYGYLEGAPYSVDDMHDPHKSLLIAKKLALWHRSPIAGDGLPSLLPTLRKWFKEIPAAYDTPETHALFEKSINVELIECRIDELEVAINKSVYPVVFCHNDLLSANIIDRKDLSRMQ